jgi:hypothetical protein
MKIDTKAESLDIIAFLCRIWVRIFLYSCTRLTITFIIEYNFCFSLQCVFYVLGQLNPILQLESETRGCISWSVIVRNWGIGL